MSKQISWSRLFRDRDAANDPLHDTIDFFNALCTVTTGLLLLLSVVVNALDGKGDTLWWCGVTLYMTAWLVNLPLQWSKRQKRKELRGRA